MKALVFDSSSIITLALNDLLYILEPLKKVFGGDFYITKTIKEELIDYSIQTKKFMLEALMIQNLVEKKIIKVYQQKVEIGKLLNAANKIFKVDDRFVNLIHEGEASCLALYKTLETEKKAVVIDERTTRMLCEAPEQLHRLLEKKLHTRLKADKLSYQIFKNIKIIRSSELAFIALKKNIIKFRASKQKILEALLYALKFKGCAISTKEIEELL
ncbi:MAG: hypothetical protein QXP53_01060 [Candidatus Pacearchaeota archaeon]